MPLLDLYAELRSITLVHEEDVGRQFLSLRQFLSKALLRDHGNA